MCLIAGYTWLKRELVNWKVNKKKLSGMRYKKSKGWKNTEERVRDEADTMKFTPHFTGIPKGRGKRKQGRSHIWRDDSSELFKTNWKSGVNLIVFPLQIAYILSIVTFFSFFSFKILKIFCNFTTIHLVINLFLCIFLGVCCFQKLRINVFHKNLGNS